ncbi:type II secretion system protein GspM [Mariprofundus erugo]|nr:type II secretion system protein GspM [Mariprofundus erugo]
MNRRLKELLSARLEAQWLPLRERVETDLLPRFQQLQSRERYLLLAAAFILPLMMLIFLLILPMQDRITELNRSLKIAQQQAGEAERLARQLVAGGGSKMAPVNVLSDVERLARASKVRQYMTRIRPQNMPDSRGQRLLIELKDVPYNDMLHFVDALAGARLELINMKVQPGSSAALVQVQSLIGTR